VSPAAAPADSLGRAESVHYLMIPTYEEARLNVSAEAQMATLQDVVVAGRVVRDRTNISLKTPVKEVRFIGGRYGEYWGVLGAVNVVMMRDLAVL
jgi:isoleucyl-tRNA synthetase